ncbi:MAG TPA: hypothetical protein VHS55_05215 [Solirubrobacteraceae bacterium]|nr:hypothetical protein [Solirubrobacteraceae bacterium]
MNGERPVELALLLWRIETLERVELAIQHELHELRGQIARREEVYSRAEAQNVFVTRKELEARSSERRQWPVILASVAVAIVSVTNLILTLGGGH